VDQKILSSHGLPGLQLGHNLPDNAMFTHPASASTGVTAGLPSRALPNGRTAFGHPSPTTICGWQRLRAPVSIGSAYAPAGATIFVVEPMQPRVGRNIESSPQQAIHRAGTTRWSQASDQAGRDHAPRRTMRRQHHDLPQSQCGSLPHSQLGSRKPPASGASVSGRSLPRSGSRTARPHR
jgi:hypothetical protein